MFAFLTGRKKRGATFKPQQEVDKLVELGPPSALLFLSDDENNDQSEPLGKVFFLRKEKKLYTQRNHLYMTKPNNLKVSKDQNLTFKHVSLRFMNKRVPYRLDCKIVGRFRLLPEVVETLDFNTKSAYKLVPTSTLKKQDQRQFFRYTLKNYGDSRIPLTTHIGFDLYVRKTDQSFPKHSTLPVILKDIVPIDFKKVEGNQQFATHDAINAFRSIMLKKQPHDRKIAASKIDKDESNSLMKRKDEELLLGDLNLLGMEMESLRDVLYLKKSAKAQLKKGKESPFGMKPGEKVITNFKHSNEYYQMLVEVMEARTQNETVRPVELPRKETGLKANLINYSVGGALIESSPEFLQFVLGDQCPSNADSEIDYEGEYWENAFRQLELPVIHLTFYPKIHFPDALQRFKPELPFKVRVLAQIVRTHIHQVGERKVLQHGLQFCYEPQGIPLYKDDGVDWRYCRYIRDNEHFKKAHSRLSQLYGYLENQSITRRTTDQKKPKKRT